MSNRYDLVTIKKDRDGKARYTRVGTMFPSREGDGFALKFDALPLPNDKGEVWVSAFVPRERDEMPQRRHAGEIEDDIPF